MDRKVLFVDDDPNILAAYSRQLRKKFDMETASSGEKGLDLIRTRGPYAVIISDIKMPGMNGIEFLSHARDLAPDSIRIILSGNADLQLAVEGVNEGNIFRFLMKPCSTEVLVKAVDQGINHNALITAERELLEKTLSGSIKVLSDVLALLNPEACGRASRISRYVTGVARRLEAPALWRLETAARLSQIGCIILSGSMLQKLYQGGELNAEEARLFNKHPAVAADLISNIPRMQEVAEIIAYQEKRFDGSGIPVDSRRGASIPLGARILKAVLDFDSAEAAVRSKEKALARLRKRPEWYDPQVLAALEEEISGEAGFRMKEVSLQELKESMILAEEVRTLDNSLLLSRGQEINLPLLQRLWNFAMISGVREPIKVLVQVENPLAAARG